jgi:capsular polysaccharide biosynthesis protein
MQKINDEVSMYDYMNIMVKYKKIILGIFVVAMIAACLVSLALPKVYQTTIVLQNGYIEEPLMNKAEIESILRSEYFLRPIIKEAGLSDKVAKLQKKIRFIDINGTNYFKIQIEYAGRDELSRLSKSVIDSYLEYPGDSYNKRLEFMKEKVVELDDQMNVIKKEKPDINSLIQVLASSKNIDSTNTSVPLLFLSSSMPSYEQNFLSLLAEKRALQLSILKSKPFKIIDPGSEKLLLIRPNIILNIICAGILGLIFAIFISFFSEYRKNTKTP